MRIIHVLRKPLSEGTVAANTLKHGTGGINIDASRIGTTDSLGGGRLSGPTRMDQTCGGNEWDRPWMNDPSLREGYAKATAEKVAKAEKMGRWPANVILQHLDGCRCDGIRTAGSGRFVAHDAVVRKSTMMDPDKGWNGNSLDNSKKSAPNSYGQEMVANWICEPGCPVVRLDEQSDVSRFYKQVGSNADE